MSIAVRPERVGDERAIARLIARAFAGALHSDGGEAAIVERLRQAGALTISLVAEDSDGIVGHVAFSPVTIAGAEGWFGLGPVAVAPDRQGTGYGFALIADGLARLGDLGANGCVVLGDPRYYGRFGFRHDSALRYPGPPPEYFQALALRGSAPAGAVAYHPAFSA